MKIYTLLLFILLQAIAVSHAYPEETTTGKIKTIAMASEWNTYIDSLKPLGEKIIADLPNPDDKVLRYEAYKRLFSEISRAYLGLFTGDEKYPDFWPVFNGAYTVGSANPDDSYYMAALEGSGVYRISGFRGTVRLVDFQTGTGYFYTRGEKKWSPTFDTYDLDELDIEENGHFEVILSEKKPDGYTGNWWYLNPKSTYTMVRQVAYDWINEEDGRFAIERLDLPAMPPVSG